MNITRRGFLKLLASAAGVSVVPSVLYKFPESFEPVKWDLSEFDWGHSFGVGATWADGTRHAVIMRCPLPEEGTKMRQLYIAQCKQALRQWYLERKAV